MKRRAGQASIEEHPKGSGTYRVRARMAGKLKTIVSKVSLAEAQELADGYAVIKGQDDLKEGLTLSQFGLGFLDRRERAGVRAIQKDRARWSLYVDRDRIGKLAVTTLRRRDVMEWLDRRSPLAHQTKKNALNLLRVGLQEAVDRELLEQNPARDVRVHKSSSAVSTDGLDGVLTPAEQQALIAAVPPRERPTVVFALCTGLRQAEQWWLRWGDVAPDRVIVRRSVGGLPPKGGRPREVHFLPPVIAALSQQRRRNDIVFPAARGGRRDNGKPPRGWKKWLRAAGITRNVHWHDLRHTCATSLLAGWWGRKWSLDEVCRFLGHSSVQVTERYARKLTETQQLAVSGTAGFVFPAGDADVPKALLSPDNSGAFLNRWSAVRLCPGAPGKQLKNATRCHGETPAYCEHLTSFVAYMPPPDLDPEA
jgi:integrase